MNIALHREIVDIDVVGGQVEGVLALPESPAGIILFAHGSGSSRTSPRNTQVAAQLRRHGLGTLLMDLLTTEEDWDTPARFDIPKLAVRLGMAAAWLAQHEITRGLPLGLFGASTGAAAALQVAAEQPTVISAVVSRGGRPELIGQAALAAVRAPTLLIVGGLDTEVLALNRRALDSMNCPRDMTVVSGATHLFEEAGALNRVAELAGSWFIRYLARNRS